MGHEAGYPTPIISVTLFSSTLPPCPTLRPTAAFGLSLGGRSTAPLCLDFHLLAARLVCILRVQGHPWPLCPIPPSPPPPQVLVSKNLGFGFHGDVESKPAYLSKKQTKPVVTLNPSTMVGIARMQSGSVEPWSSAAAEGGPCVGSSPATLGH